MMNKFKAFPADPRWDNPPHATAEEALERAKSYAHDPYILVYQLVSVHKVTTTVDEVGADEYEALVAEREKEREVFNAASLPL